MSLLRDGRMNARLVIEADHPALPGHFPGEPVAPGVVVLDRLIEAAEASIGSPLHVTGMPQVKFLAPLLPGQTAQATLELRQPQAVQASALRTSDGEAHVSTMASLKEAGTAHREPVPMSLHFRVEREGQLIAQGAFNIAIESTH